jgi:hypothetical protein
LLNSFPAVIPAKHLRRRKKLIHRHLARNGNRTREGRDCFGGAAIRARCDENDTFLLSCGSVQPL